MADNCMFLTAVDGPSLIERDGRRFVRGYLLLWDEVLEVEIDWRSRAVGQDRVEAGTPVAVAFPDFRLRPTIDG